MPHVIDAKELGKRYVTKQGLPGRWARSSTEIQALSQLTLQVSNETLAVIGPNGAGKSTLVKLLTGLLIPSSGEITVCGLDPWRERRSLSHLIGVVLGHRSRLWYHLTAMESLALLGRMYDLNTTQVKQRLAELVEMFDADAFISQQVSSLSLGQRMRCEVMAALIHSPRLLLLDEPTIGLDVVAKQNLREHLAEIAARGDATILLTSHDLTDIQHLAQRVLILDGGRCVFDGSLTALTSAYVHERRIVAFVSGTYQPVDLPGVTGLEVTGGEVNLSVDTALTPVHVVAEHLLRSNDVTDISITEPPLEETIARIYKDGVLQ